MFGHVQFSDDFLNFFFLRNYLILHHPDLRKLIFMKILEEKNKNEGGCKSPGVIFRQKKIK
jgi:hypothetical protein